ncbi:MAG: GPR endopeptidase [Christensenellales bacterium]
MGRSIYTDLALESREMNPRIDGVEEINEKDGEISITRIKITADEAAKKLDKQKGSYITLDAPELVSRPLDLFEAMSKCLCKEIKLMIPKLGENASIMIAGLGNRMITPDSLGPRVAEQVYVTRHITEYMPDAMDHPLRSVCSVAPGVLGVTGVETSEIVRGIVEHVKPDLIIAIDSLAARRASRISTMIQLTDTGISPGSGVGNARAGLTLESLGVPVMAIGVPLVVYASTVAQDTIELMADETGLHNDEERLKALAEKVISEHMGPMIMTPKDIDSMVGDMSRIIADGINLAIHDMNYDEVKALIA